MVKAGQSPQKLFFNTLEWRLHVTKKLQLSDLYLLSEIGSMPGLFTEIYSILDAPAKSLLGVVLGY